MIEYVLILFIYAGTWSKGDSVALTNVAHFKTLVECQNAGVIASDMTQDTIKSTKFVCVKQGQ